MKTVITIAAIVLTAAPAYADRNKPLIRSNVVCAGASAPGFTLGGDRFIAEAASASCPDSAYTVVPSSVDVRDLGDVLAWLDAEGFEGVTPLYSNGAEVCREFAGGECVKFDSGRNRW